MQIVRKELDVRLLYTHFRGIFKKRDVLFDLRVYQIVRAFTTLNANVNVSNLSLLWNYS